MKTICPTAQALTVPLWRRRIEARYTENSETGCWEWTGQIDRYGYGRIHTAFGGRERYTGAHRASWIIHRGPIVGDLTIDHLCRNKICINPWHLEPVTNEENIRRASASGAYAGGGGGRPRVALPERRGCKRHGLSDGTWRTRKDGYTAWHCRPCNTVRCQAWKERQNLKKAAGE